MNLTQVSLLLEVKEPSTVAPSPAPSPSPLSFLPPLPSTAGEGEEGKEEGLDGEGGGEGRSGGIAWNSPASPLAKFGHLGATHPNMPHFPPATVEPRPFGGSYSIARLHRPCIASAAGAWCSAIGLLCWSGNAYKFGARRRLNGANQE